MNGKEHIGERQWALIERGRASTLKLIYVTTYVEMRSCRKLVKRGLLVQQGLLPLFWLNEEKL